MKCAVHAEVDAAGFCRHCGKSLCDQCKRDVRGALYCEDCLADQVARPAAAGGPNPALAAVLGCVPGLGAVYNGEYVKGLLHVVILGSLFALADRAHAGPLFAFLIIGFWFYMPVDAYRTAKARLEGGAPRDALALLSTKQPVGAYVLIILGGIMLLDNLLPDFDPWRWLGKAWPVVLIALGIWMLRGRLQRPSQETKQDG